MVKIQGYHLFKTGSVGMEHIVEALSFMAFTRCQIVKLYSFQVILLNMYMYLDHTSLAKVCSSNKMNTK